MTEQTISPDVLTAYKERITEDAARGLRRVFIGTKDAEQVFGVTITNSRGRKVPITLLASQHIVEDLGFVPTLDHYLELLRCPRWASKPARLLHSKLTLAPAEAGDNP